MGDNPRRMNDFRAAPGASAGAGRAPLVLAPSRGWVPLRLRELWEYRGLLYFLVWRDLKVRYKQTALGAAWAVIQPVATMVVFSVVFGRLAGMPSDGVPYPLFAFAALVPWTLFADGFSQAAASLVMNGNLVRKVYFPRLVLPAAAVLSSLVDFALAFAVLAAMLAAYGVAPTAAVLWLPALVLLALASALGVGLWLAAIAVRFRDVRHGVPFLRQLWLFATPIAYPASLLDEPWRTLYGLNPMAGVVEGFRRALLGTDTAAGPMVLASVGAAVALLVSGAYFFRRTERQMADLL